MVRPQARLEPVSRSDEQLEPSVLRPLAPDLFEVANNLRTRLRLLRPDGRITGFEMFGPREIRWP